MGKIKRGKDKPKKQKFDDMPTMCVGAEYCQTGCVVQITSIPNDVVKKGKKFKEKKMKKLGFVPGSKHEVVEPYGNNRNTLASVHLKGNDGEVYQIGFSFYKLTRYDKDGNYIKGFLDRYDERKKENAKKHEKMLKEEKKKDKKKDKKKKKNK